MLMLIKLIWSFSIQLIIPELHKSGTVLGTESIYIRVRACVCVGMCTFLFKSAHYWGKLLCS